MIRLTLISVSALSLLVGFVMGANRAGKDAGQDGVAAGRLPATVRAESFDCDGGVPPVGGWAPWAFEADGFKPYEMTLAEAVSRYSFELPTVSPVGFERVDDLVSVVYMTGSDFTLHVLWQHPSRRETGETITMYVKHGAPYAGHEPGAVWWLAPDGIEYELAATDPDIDRDALVAMACSMASYVGTCP